jgi:hypothetical protein
MTTFLKQYYTFIKHDIWQIKYPNIKTIYIYYNMYDNYFLTRQICMYIHLYIYCMLYTHISLNALVNINNVIKGINTM